MESIHRIHSFSNMSACYVADIALEISHISNIAMCDSRQWKQEPVLMGLITNGRRRDK